MAFLRTVARAYAAHAAGAAVVLGIAGIVWKLPPSKLAVSYVVLVVAGSGISTSVWTFAQPARAQPKAYTIRVVLGIFVYTVMVASGLLFGATWMGLVSQDEAVRYGVSIFNVMVLVSFPLYFVLRGVFSGRQRSGPA